MPRELNDKESDAQRSRVRALWAKEAGGTQVLGWGANERFRMAESSEQGTANDISRGQREKQRQANEPT